MSYGRTSIFACDRDIGERKMKAEKGNNLEKELQKMLIAIHPADPCVAETALKRWNSIAKPLHSLGKLEKTSSRLQG